MGLRWRLLLLFLLAAFVPFVALGLVVQKTLVEELEEDHRRLLESRVEAARRRLAEREAEDRRAVQALCDHDLVVDRLLLDLATDRFDPSREQSLVTLLPPLMRGRRFDTLHLLDARSGRDRGRVLGAGHYPESVGADAAALLDATVRARGEPFVRDVRVATEAGPRDRRTLLQGCVAERDGVAVGVVAGRHLDEGFGEALLGDVQPVAFAVAGPDETPRLPGSDPPVTVARFLDASGEPALRLLAAIDDAPLREDVDGLRQRSLYVAAGAFGVALLLAFVMTWTLSRPLRDLEEATRRVAGGDLESQIRVKARGEVGRTLQAFNAMTRELAATRQKLLRAERIAAWREVARRIAHEIKNPLQPIQMEIETMRKLHARGHPSFDEEFEQSTSLILEEVKRMNNMVTEFSRFARLPRPKPEPLDLRELAQHVAGLHDGGEVALELHLPTEATVVRADREQLTQVLVNLVQNACDAASARHPGHGARVELALAPTADGAELRVADNGMGIAPDDRLRIFEPYFTTKAKGTGLGLAIVHRIVGDHGGSIDVEDGLDGGAAFVVLLPKGGPPEAIAASLSDTALPLTPTAR